jgi:hypothetical protein
MGTQSWFHWSWANYLRERLVAAGHSMSTLPKEGTSPYIQPILVHKKKKNNVLAGCRASRRWHQCHDSLATVHDCQVPTLALHYTPPLGAACHLFPSSRFAIHNWKGLDGLPAPLRFPDTSTCSAPWSNRPCPDVDTTACTSLLGCAADFDPVRYIHELTHHQSELHPLEPTTANSWA